MLSLHLPQTAFGSSQPASPATLSHLLPPVLILGSLVDSWRLVAPALVLVHHLPLPASLAGLLHLLPPVLTLECLVLLSVPQALAGLLRLVRHFRRPRVFDSSPPASPATLLRHPPRGLQLFFVATAVPLARHQHWLQWAGSHLVPDHRWLASWPAKP